MTTGLCATISRTLMNRKRSSPCEVRWGVLAALACALMGARARDSGQTDTSAAPPNHAPRGSVQPDLVRFRNGDLLYGKLEGIEAESGLRWKHADVAEPIAFKLDNVLELQLRDGPSTNSAAPNTCLVRL